VSIVCGSGRRSRVEDCCSGKFIKLPVDGSLVVIYQISIYVVGETYPGIRLINIIKERNPA
jgi:hypothetical protein